MSDAAKPLEGLLVVSMEQAVAAPLCTARLADAGARVIKIEREGGDFARAYDNAALGDSSYFAWLNHSKESIELNIKLDADKKLLHKIIASADVFVQNFSPGALQRADLGSSELRALHPSLITCDISGYGGSDAMHGMKAYDLLIQAESGLLAVTGDKNSPGRIGVSLCDIGAGITAYTGILEALIGRGISGEGAALSVSLFDVAAEWMSVPYVHSTSGDGAPQRVGLKHPGLCPYGAFATNDNLLTLISIQNEREWVRLCEDVLQEPSLLADEHYQSNVERVKHRERLEGLITDITKTMSADKFRERCHKASIAYGALNSVAEFAEHTALRLRSITNSFGNTLNYPSHPVIRTQTNDRPSKSPKVPVLGAHTELIKQEFD